MEQEINNHVESLIAIERTKSQVDEFITNLDDIREWTDDDKEFLESFKRIYHTGLDQLERFINKLDEDGDKLDESSILYYKRQLVIGPLAAFLPQYTEDKKYWLDQSDVMGVTGNMGGSSNSSPVWDNKSLNVPVDVFNKMPEFMFTVISETNDVINSVLTGTFISPIVNDNTLPYIDKGPQSRIDEEYDKGRNVKPHANHMVKDVELAFDISAVSADIFDKVKEFLVEDSDFRLFAQSKKMNPFKDTVSKASNLIVNRGYTKGEEDFSVATDLFGSQFDSEDKMAFELLIKGEDKDRKFKLRTVKGQLGSGEEVKSEPIKD